MDVLALTSNPACSLLSVISTVQVLGLFGPCGFGVSGVVLGVTVLVGGFSFFGGGGGHWLGFE